ncbi:alpha beta-hydrolase [Coniophora puteana RWD-64-598 SS2]|uniref:Alpha beta-hydrolase n=1 Tax=Coniophora puteana (strain RWD-64-598) TaxID=741705 RepID=A0A5M3N3V9_CONPW|nr:alpha beta-hydrolase [Coniophora puteana RWD-64-598 SS2]EIW85535.1 alpha beta-hydrolase [Coniophora puteana RWD-64-598 SS2]
MAYSVVVKELKSSDGNKIYAEAIGDPSKPSIILVHGIMLSCAIWDNLFEDQKLVERLYLIRYDVRGHGRSGKPDSIEGHASSLYAADFKTVADAFGAKKPLEGTTGADICAHLDPIPLAGMVYMCALPYVDPALIQAVATPALLNVAKGVTVDDNAVSAIDSRIKFTEALFRDHHSVPWKTKLTCLGSSTLMAPRDCRFVISRPQNEEKLMEAGRNGMPLLVIVAAHDEVVNGEVAVKTFEPHFTRIEVKRISNSGHAAHIDQQDEFVNVLLEFTLGCKHLSNKLYAVL